MIRKFPFPKGLLHTLSQLEVLSVLEGKWIRNQYDFLIWSETLEAHQDLTRM